MALEPLLKELRERDQGKLESQQEKLDNIYKDAPGKIQRIAELSGMTGEAIVRSCTSAAWPYEHLEWYSALDIVCGFFLAKKRLEEKEQGEVISSSS